MLSTCPNCLEQVTHDDNLFEVSCPSCKNKFNPFLSPSDTEGVEAGLGLGSVDAAAEAGAPGAEGAENFSESNAIFQELRDFGENLLTPSEESGAAGPDTGSGVSPGSSEDAAATSAPPPPKRAAAPRKSGGTPPAEAERWMTSGATLPGFEITALLAPISLWSDVPGDGANPLGQAFEALWAEATGLGAAAVIGIHWALSTDGSRCLISGIPVQGMKSA